MKASERFARFARQFDAKVWQPASPSIAELFGTPLEDAFACYPPGQLRTENQAGHKWAVEAHLLDCNMWPTAFVGKEDGLYCIGMPVSTAAHLVGLAHRLFADPSLFPFIHDGSEPEPRLPRTDRVLIGWPHEQLPEPAKIDAEDFEQSFKLGPRRQVMAVWLGQLAVELVWHHELGHIAHGHVDFAAIDHHIAHLGEVIAGAPQGALPDQQIMELYADGFAIQPLLRRMTHIHDWGRKIQFLTMTQHAALLRFAHYMVNASWCLADIWHERQLDAVLAANSHPPSAYRLFFGNEHNSDIMRALGISDEVVEGSEALYTEAIRHTNQQYEDFSWISEALTSRTDQLFDYAYRMRGPETYFARWRTYSYFR